MTFFIVAVAFVIILMVIAVTAVAVERRRPILIARAQINFTQFKKESFDCPMSVFEAARSLRFGSRYGADLRCRVSGPSLSGYGVFDGDLLGVHLVTKQQTTGARLAADGAVTLSNGARLQPGESILLLPYTQNPNPDAQKFGQKLRCFIEAKEDRTGEIRIYSKKVDDEGTEDSAWHDLSDLIGVAYANLSANRLL